MTLNDFSDIEFCDWFTSGIALMRDKDPGRLQQAFAPVADAVGCRDDRTWLDEVVEIIGNLEDDGKKTCYRGLSLAVSRLSNDIDNDRWTDLNFAISIMRKLGPSAIAFDSLQSVAACLPNQTTKITYDVRKQLISGALLALFDCHEGERPGAHAIALELTCQLRDEDPSVMTSMRFRQRLSDFGIPEADINALNGAEACYGLLSRQIS